MQTSNMRRATLAIALAITTAAWHVPSADASPFQLIHKIKRSELDPKTGRWVWRPIIKDKDAGEDSIEAIEAEPEAAIVVYRPCGNGSGGKSFFRDATMVSAKRGEKIETLVIDLDTACWKLGLLVTYDGSPASDEIELATGLLEFSAHSNFCCGGSRTDGSESTSTDEASACEVTFQRRFTRTPIIITSERRTLEQDRDAATMAVTRIRKDGFSIAVDAENPAPTAIEWIAIGTPFSEGNPDKVLEAARRSESWNSVLIDMVDHTKESEEAARLLKFLLGRRIR